MRIALPLLALLWAFGGARGQDAGVAESADPDHRPGPESDAQSALERLNLPGIKINLAERCVDVESLVCLGEGTLELVACTTDSKEHESIVAVEAKAMHVHTALLLLGAKPGNPAMRKAIDKAESRWIDIPPRGGGVEVFLCIKDEEGKTVERPISEFIKRVGENAAGKPAKKEKTSFPTHRFLFAGSHLQGAGVGPRQYLADRSGNVISIATFGDEMLCLPGVHGHENGALRWEVDATHLPAVGTKVLLRLRPKLEPARKPDPRIPGN